MVLFGVTGDLARKKVMPAIYDLANRGLLPPGFSLTGFARRDWANQDFEQIVHDSVKAHARTEFREEVWRQLAEGFRFVPGDFDDDAAFDHLRRTIEELDQDRGTGGNHAFYLAIPPGFFGDVVGQLKEHGLADPSEDSWRRVVVEKPFGHDLASARELNAMLDTVFPTGSVFRIDHYLGKETVQNILAIRFANTMFEPIWNAHYVDHVQITMAEDVGIGGRAGYYDGIGAARDVIQNHLLQLMSLIAMEEPTSFDAEALRIEKQKVLSSVVLPAAARPDHRPRPVRARLGRWREGRGLPRRGGHPQDLADRDLRRHQARGRHPALGRRAVLPPHRQAPRPPGHRGGGRVQACSAPAVRGVRDRGAHAQRPRHPGAARRGDDDAVRVEGARPVDGDPRRQHGLRLRRILHGGQPRGLRAADPRRAARGPAAVPAARGGRALLADPGPDPGPLGAQGPAPGVPAPAPGVRSPRTRCSRATAGSGGDHDRAHRHHLLGDRCGVRAGPHPRRQPGDGHGDDAGRSWSPRRTPRRP